VSDRISNYRSGRQFDTLEQAFLGGDGIQFYDWAIDQTHAQPPNEALRTICWRGSPSPAIWSVASENSTGSWTISWPKSGVR
jgi:hypothetical protein